jgi:hypothetical protein
LGEGLENPQSVLVIAPIEFNMSDLALDFRSALRSQFCEPLELDRTDEITDSAVDGQRLLQLTVDSVNPFRKAPIDST